MLRLLVYQFPGCQSPRCCRCPYPTGLRAWSSVRGPRWTSQSLPLWLWRRPFVDSSWSGLPLYFRCSQRYSCSQGPAVFSSHRWLWCSFLVSRPASRLPGCCSPGHCVYDCPFNGVWHPCRQPGHAACECASRQPSAAAPASNSVPPVPSCYWFCFCFRHRSFNVCRWRREPDFFDLSAYESGYCSGDNECSVLLPLLSWFPVPGSVLLRLHLLRLLVWLSSLLLGPPSIPKTTSLMSCRVNLILLLPLGLRSCCCKVRFCIFKVFCYKVRYFLLPLVFSCFWKAGSFTAKSSGCLSTNWGISGRSGSGYVVFECPDSQVFWDFGSLSRSIEEVDSISFEYTIVSWIMVVVRFRGRKRLLCCVSLLYLKMLLTPCLLVCLPSSLDNNLSLSSTDPLLMYSTSSCCISVFVASYFASYCLLVGEVRHLGELGGLVPPSIPVCCLWCVLWLFLVAIALIPPGGGHSP